MKAPGPYQIQAAISALHAQARSSIETGWTQIAVLYAMLCQVMPSPVVELNRAVAIAMAESIERGLSLLSRLEETGDLSDYHLFHAARADLLRRSGKFDEARIAYIRALALCQNNAECAFFQRRRTEIERQTG